MGRKNMSDKTITYEMGDGDLLTFSLICPKCGQIVEYDADIDVNYFDFRTKDGTNATCKNCGRVEMEYVDFEMN
jgi:ribosomal protein S27AE